MFPEAFIKRIKTQEYIDHYLLLEALSRPSPVSIRLNPYKWDKAPEGSSEVPWCESGFYLTSHPSFTADPLYHAGCYYPQEASGMFIGEIYKAAFKGKTGLRVLDLCGAPGSKSTHLAALIGNSGCLIANEVIKSRAAVLAENVTRWGIPNTIVTNNDPDDFSKLAGCFDLIIVDAPCSGEGMFRSHAARLQWSENVAGLCSRRQRRILAGVWPALRENGLLIYSTCTFNPAENEENIKWLSENVLAESMKINISAFPGITEISYKGVTGYCFCPGRITGDGFFVSVLRKPERNKRPDIIIRRNADKVTKEERRAAERLTGIEGINLVKLNNTLIHAPDESVALSNPLRVLKQGTELFRIIKGEVIPEHSMAVSSILKKDAYPVVELNYNQAVNYLRKENPGLSPPLKGWYLAAYKGSNLGFIKSTGSRLNNSFPVELRIKMNPETLGEKKVIEWCE